MFAIIEVIINSRAFKLCVVAFMAAYAWFMLIAPIAHGWPNAISTWKEWQTFNAAIIAFLSTLLIVHSTKVAEQRSALRKRNASKAFMPIALSELSGYLVELIQLLDDLHQEKKDFEIELKLQLPESAFKQIEKFIEQSSAEDEVIVNHLTIAISSVQIYDARIVSILTDSFISNKKEQAFYQINQCVLLHALLSGMYDFARGVDDKYDVIHLDSDRFRIKDCPLYMTDPEIEDYQSREINLKLFVSS